jgi:hypothetical protein
MTLEALQLQWQSLDQKIEQTLTLQRELTKQIIIQPARRRINRLAFWPAIDVAFCAVVLLVLGSFAYDHRQDWRIVLPSLIVAFGMILLLSDSIRQLFRIAELDWTGPVAVIQQSLDGLRVAKIRQFKWVILLSPLVGFCGLLVGLHGLFELLTEGQFLILDKLDAGWIVANYIFGVLFVPAGYILAGLLAKRCERLSWWRSVLDDIAGISLKRVRQDVEHWANLQKL